MLGNDLQATNLHIGRRKWTTNVSRNHNLCSVVSLLQVSFTGPIIAQTLVRGHGSKFTLTQDSRLSCVQTPVPEYGVAAIMRT